MSQAGSGQVLTLGDCRFERADEALGIADADTWTFAFSATWEGANELPTLAFGGYVTPDRTSCADGRLVRTLVDERRNAGTFLVPWDGTDTYGTRAASGTYLFRLRSGGLSDTRKATLLK